MCIWVYPWDFKVRKDFLNKRKNMNQRKYSETLKFIKTESCSSSKELKESEKSVIKISSNGVGEREREREEERVRKEKKKLRSRENSPKEESGQRYGLAFHRWRNTNGQETLKMLNVISYQGNTWINCIILMLSGKVNIHDHTRCQAGLWSSMEWYNNRTMHCWLDCKLWQFGIIW